ncbi:hypothetical protein MFFC18_50660 [Mariniblastus fucicola]|uniref:Uncharacterized protein n=1 Tax=Mariniblastus fucicola TaxID=980251 RepID=A0A5B9PK98_9BACT|nr:hypothetical protein MFFC18_50660 [Mariniblastus fucicola]
MHIKCADLPEAPGENLKNQYLDIDLSTCGPYPFSVIQKNFQFPRAYQPLLHTASAFQLLVDPTCEVPWAVKYRPAHF